MKTTMKMNLKTSIHDHLIVNKKSSRKGKPRAKVTKSSSFKPEDKGKIKEQGNKASIRFPQTNNTPNLPPQLIYNLLNRGLPPGQMPGNKGGPSFMPQIPPSNEIAKLLASQGKLPPGLGGPLGMFSPQNPLNGAPGNPSGSSPITTLIQERVKQQLLNNAIKNNKQIQSGPLPGLRPSQLNTIPPTEPNISAHNMFLEMMKFQNMDWPQRQNV